METLAQNLQARTSQDSVEYLLKYGQLILTILGIIAIVLYIAENPARIKSLSLAAAT
jgi:hypothetical protein